MSSGPTVLAPGLAALTNRSEERKRAVRAHLGAEPWFPGTAQRHSGFLDAYHGETGLAPDPNAVAALDRAWRELLHGEQPDTYRDGKLYDKRQPQILRNLAADKLFGRLSQPIDGVPGVRVRPEEVIVCPYSSTMLLEEAIATLAEPGGGVIVYPEGLYKSSGIHLEKYGLRPVACPVGPDDSFKIDPELLARCLDHYAERGELRGVLLTLPGNPVFTDYSVEEMLAIGRVLLDRDVPIICDMAFDAMVAQHIPVASLEIATDTGVRRLYDRVLTITGNSKGYNAFGPCKLGAACSGDREWLTRIRHRLTISFQRESTHLAQAIIAHTPDSYFAGNRLLMLAQLDRAHGHIAAINDRFGAKVLRPLGSRQGMFLTMVFDDDVLDMAGIGTGAELEDLLLTAAGIDCVGLDRAGSDRRGVRCNVLAPRKAVGRTSDALLDELFDRLEQLLRDIHAGLTYRDVLVRVGLADLEPIAAQ
ncbi:pyridoxal phosphate-dependent aminotransferase [Nocardia sp. NPDC052566]|uniref:pyridoxal phosphate-dependent aminotransferase n=1 Tax=Nocardia sp. NPDC052566 TaxID=3364330 RepID=UPI0037C6D864